MAAIIDLVLKTAAKRKAIVEGIQGLCASRVGGERKASARVCTPVQTCWGGKHSMSMLLCAYLYMYICVTDHTFACVEGECASVGVCTCVYLHCV